MTRRTFVIRSLMFIALCLCLHGLSMSFQSFDLFGLGSTLLGKSGRRSIGDRREIIPLLMSDPAPRRHRATMDSPQTIISLPETYKLSMDLNLRLSGTSVSATCPPGRSLVPCPCCMYPLSGHWTLNIDDSIKVRAPEKYCRMSVSRADDISSKQVRCACVACRSKKRHPISDVNYLFRFVPLPQRRVPLEIASPSRSGSNLNVLYLFLDGATTHLTNMWLPKLRELLRSYANTSPSNGNATFTCISGGLTLPLGDRTVHNAPAMMAGWPDGERWFTTLVAPRDRKTMAQMASTRPNIPLPSLERKFKRARRQVFSDYVDDSLFHHFQRHGYVTQAVAANEEVDPSAGFMTFWQDMRTIDYEHYDLATTEGKFGAKIQSAGHRHVAEYGVDLVLDMWNHYPNRDKFTVVYDANAHFPHEEMLSTSDDAYVRLLRELEAKGHLTRTAIFIVSDHMTHTNPSVDVLDPAGDRMLSELWLPVSSRPQVPPHVLTELKESTKKEERQQHRHVINGTKFLTHFDWHKTIRDLVYHTPATKADHHVSASKFSPRASPPSDLTVSLFRSVPGVRRCADVHVRPGFCPYSTREQVRRNDSIIQLMGRYLEEAFDEYNKETNQVDKWCERLVAPENGFDFAVATRADGHSEVVATFHQKSVVWQVLHETLTATTTVTRRDSWRRANAPCFQQCKGGVGLEKGQKKHHGCGRIFTGGCVCNVAQFESLLAKRMVNANASN